MEKEEHPSPPLLVGLQAGTTTLKSVCCFLRKLDIVLPDDLALPLLGIYPDDSLTCNKDTCYTMFIAARSWEEPICSSTLEWIQKMWYIYTIEYTIQVLKTKNLLILKFLGK